MGIFGRRFLLSALAAGVGGCGGQHHEPAPVRPVPAPVAMVTAAPAEDPEPPMATLTTSVHPAADNPEILIASVVACDRGTEFETLKIALPPDFPVSSREVVDVPGAVAMVGDTFPAAIFVRRPLEGATVEGGSIYQSDWRMGRGRRRFTLTATTVACRRDPSLEREYLTAVRDHFHENGAFAAFATTRLLALAPPTARSGTLYRPHSELVDAMDTLTGREGIQQALQSDRKLVTDGLRAPRRHPLREAKSPILAKIPFERLTASRAHPLPVEPLAGNVPRDFYYLRAASFVAVLDAMDLVETWGQPAADALDGHLAERGTVARYEAELAFERTSLARILGPEVIGAVAITGSDPYVHEGTDVTVLFQVKQRTLFDVALSTMLSHHAEKHGGVVATSFVHEGVTVHVATSPDGRVRQHRAALDGLEIVSNSKAAIRRVLSAALGKEKRLADEPDFRYLLARDAETGGDVMAFAGDAFVESIVGPGKRIAQARRELALAELSQPGFAALLFGVVNGRAPKDVAELTRQKILSPGDSKHFDGSSIVVDASFAGHSRFGSAAALEPLIDLPAVDALTDKELGEYREFAQRYQWTWSDYVDPTMIRATRTPGTRTTWNVFVREVPLLPRSSREVVEMAGDARVSVPPIASGLRAVFGLGKEASLRRDLSEIGRGLKFDWLGNAIMVGVEDRNEVTHLARALTDFRALGDESSDGGSHSDDAVFAALRTAPVYASVEVKNPAGALLALVALKKMAEDVLPGQVKWIDRGQYRGVSVVKIDVLWQGSEKNEVSLSYALVGGALVTSPSERIVRRLIDEQLGGKAAASAARPTARADSQLVVDLGVAKGGALSTVLAWLLAEDLVEHQAPSYDAADAILRGAPDSRTGDEAFRTVSRRLFGYVPTTPDGLLYTASPEGPKDPLRGTLSSPAFPATPAPGTPLERVFARFSSLRSEVAFDTEPGSEGPEPVRSFRARAAITLAR